MKPVQIEDKTFHVIISRELIQQAVDAIALRMNKELHAKAPLFISLLNGSFMFTADLLKRLTFPCNVSFMKLASYSGDKSTGEVKQLVGLTENIEGRTVVVVEDIIDSGTTMNHLIKSLQELNPAEIIICSMFFKPDACKVPVQIDYLGMEIPDMFVVGYGLDFNGFGRNYPDLYALHYDLTR